MEVVTYDVVADSELMGGPNRDGAFGVDDKCSCDYSSYSVCERLCDTNCTRHYSAVVNAAVPCDVLMSASYSKAFHIHRTDGMRSMAEVTIIGSIRFLLHHHCLIYDFQFLFRFQPPIRISRSKRFERIFDSRFGDESVKQHREIKENNNNFRDICDYFVCSL